MTNYRESRLAGFQLRWTVHIHGSDKPTRSVFDLAHRGALGLPR